LSSLLNVYDIRDNGAVVDNSTDDAAAIAETISAAASAGGGIVYVPGVSYCGS